MIENSSTDSRYSQGHYSKGVLITHTREEIIIIHKQVLIGEKIFQICEKNLNKNIND
jgi:hypothetical protein